MKFPVDKCECGLDLTTATPVRVMLGQGPNDEPIGGCPNCWRTYFMVVKKKPTPEPEPPVVRGSRRRASEPNP